MKTKKIKKRLLFSLLCLIGFTFNACTDENNLELDKGSSPLAITISSKNIELNNGSPTSEAIRFDWTPGTNEGTSAGITYTFEMDVEEGDFKEGIKIDLGRNQRIMVYKHEELNKILLEQFSANPEETINLKARIIADVLVENVGQQISEEVFFSVKTYTPVTMNLYLLGAAAPNGWSADEATKMNTVSGTTGGFTWTGRLNKGELKFITILGQFTPSYNKGEDDTKLYYRESDEDSYDEKFEIAEAGNYEIKLNLLTKIISIVKTEGPDYSMLWIVGSSTGENGWGFEALTKNPMNSYVFHFNSRVSGEFKIATEPSFDDDIAYYRPSQQGVGEGVNLDVVKLSKNENEEDYKWNVAENNYKIKLDIQDMKIDIVPFEPYPMIYLVGEATPNGRDIDNSTPMSKTDNEFVFTWVGQLVEGDFKLSCDKQSDWNGDWFTASSGNESPTGDIQQMIYNKNGSGLDYKWNITSAGEYSIVLDQLKDTIIIKKI